MMHRYPRRSGSSVVIMRQWQALAGTWTGSNALRMMPDDTYTTGPASLQMSIGPGPDTLLITYTWEHEGSEQQGLLLCAPRDVEGTCRGVWLDTFHQHPTWMELAGTVEPDGQLQLAGAYAGGWGWRITVSPNEGLPQIVMDNVPPGSEPYPVVQLFAQPR